MTMSETEVNARLDSVVARLNSVLHETQRNSSAIYAVEMHLDSQLSQLSTTQRRMNDKIESLQRDLTDFVKQDRRDKERLFAHAGLLRVRSEIERKYGHYEAVRRNARGLLLALESGLAQDATLQWAAETQSLNAPSYWLASAMNALAAWIREDETAATRAVLHARTNSEDKTALFFGLINARFGRFNATDSWFREYLSHQNPDKLSSEMTVVLDAAMLGLLGDNTYDRVSRQVQAWFVMLDGRGDMVAQQVARWRKEIAYRCEQVSGPAGAVLGSECPVLAATSPDWKRIEDSYLQATAFEQVQAILANRLVQRGTDHSDWKSRIDGVQDGLQSIPEPGEADLRREEAHYDRIIKHKGDTAAADREREAEAPLEEPQVDLLTFLSNAALRPLHDTPPETTQLALHLASRWIKQAVADIVTETRALSKASVAVKIDGWTGRLGATPIEALAEEFAGMVDGETKKAVARARFAWPRFVGGSAAVIFLGLLGLALSRRPAFQLWPVGTLAALAAVFLLIALWAHRRIPQRVRQVKQNGQERKDRGLDTLYDAEADRERLVAACDERTREADRLNEFLESISVPELGRDLPGRRGEGLVWRTPLKLAKWSLTPGGTDKG
jgi:hypothetical protein